MSLFVEEEGTEKQGEFVRIDPDSQAFWDFHRCPFFFFLVFVVVLEVHDVLQEVFVEVAFGVDDSGAFGKDKTDDGNHMVQGVIVFVYGQLDSQPDVLSFRGFDDFFQRVIADGGDETVIEQKIHGGDA